jgi:hypothetical protein
MNLSSPHYEVLLRNALPRRSASCGEVKAHASFNIYCLDAERLKQRSQVELGNEKNEKKNSEVKTKRGCNPLEPQQRVKS